MPESIESLRAERDAARNWIMERVPHIVTRCPRGGEKWQAGDYDVCTCGLKHFMTVNSEPWESLRARADAAERERDAWRNQRHDYEAKLFAVLQGALGSPDDMTVEDMIQVLISSEHDDPALTITVGRGGLYALNNRLASTEAALRKAEDIQLERGAKISALMGELDAANRHVAIVKEATNAMADRVKVVEAALVITREQQARLEAQNAVLETRVQNLKWDMDCIAAQLGLTSRDDTPTQVMHTLQAIERAAIAATLDKCLEEVKASVYMGDRINMMALKMRFDALRPVATAPPSETP